MTAGEDSKRYFNQEFKLGVLGGGQLGKMLLQAAADFNLHVCVMDPDPSAPCSQLATEFTAGSITDYDSVMEFGRKCDLITIEIENVNTQALKDLQSEGHKVFPQPHIIELIQDKRIQKQFYIENSIPTPEFVLTEDRSGVEQHLDFLPAVHKMGKEGYDGRGVQVIRSESDIATTFDAPGLLERFVDFEKELAVITARNPSGQVVSYPVVELVFHPEHNLVEYLLSPARIPDDIANNARKLAEEVVLKLDMYGLLAVEMFLTRDHEVLVNEIAPRTHNSGHQTIESNYTSQFQQHLRAILDLPLGSVSPKIPSAMVNLLGEEGYEGKAIYQGMEDVLALEGTFVHLYGKVITRPYRKMGHVTVIDNDIDSLQEKVNFIKKTLKVIA